jgi:hypothetical protein
MIITQEDEAAFQLDLYLDRVLGGDAAAAPGWMSGPADPRLADAAALVADGAARFHPSFRFEERLARRLRDAASGIERDSGDTPVVLPFGLAAAADRARSRRVGGVLVGSAIASGVSLASLAGAAALVVWRRARPDARWGRL